MQFREPYVPRREQAELLSALDDPGIRGVLVLGPAGIGKTALLHMVKQELEEQERAAFLVSSLELRDPGDLGESILHAIAESRFRDALPTERTIRSSAGAPLLEEVTTLLRTAGGRLPSPVLLVDGLDESRYPLRLLTGVEQLSLWLDNWKIVVASRTAGMAGSGRFERFRVIELGPLDHQEAQSLLELAVPGLPASAVQTAVALAAGSPLYLTLLAQQLQQSGVLETTAGMSASSLVEALVERAIEKPPKLATVLEQLAVVGGRDHLTALATRSRLPADELRELLQLPQVRRLIVWVAPWHCSTRSSETRFSPRASSPPRSGSLT